MFAPGGGGPANAVMRRRESKLRQKIARILLDIRDEESVHGRRNDTHLDDSHKSSPNLTSYPKPACRPKVHCADRGLRQWRR